MARPRRTDDPYAGPSCLLLLSTIAVTLAPYAKAAPAASVDGHDTKLPCTPDKPLHRSCCCPYACCRPHCRRYCTRVDTARVSKLQPRCLSNRLVSTAKQTSCRVPTDRDVTPRESQIEKRGGHPSCKCFPANLALDSRDSSYPRYRAVFFSLGSSPIELHIRRIGSNHQKCSAESRNRS